MGGSCARLSRICLASFAQIYAATVLSKRKRDTSKRYSRSRGSQLHFAARASTPISKTSGVLTDVVEEPETLTAAASKKRLLHSNNSANTLTPFAIKTAALSRAFREDGWRLFLVFFGVEGLFFFSFFLFGQGAQELEIVTRIVVAGRARILVAVAKPRTVFAFGLLCCPRVSKVSTVTGIGVGPARETQNCRHF